MANYWLCKTEPESYSIDDLRRDKSSAWTGVRNYQARNFLRDMKKGEFAFIYHSSTEPPGIAGLAKVAGDPQADPTALDPDSDFFDPKSKPEAPTWVCPDLAFVEKFATYVTLEALKANPKLKDLAVLRPGNRLSVTPVGAKEFREIMRIAGSSKA